MGSNPSKFKGDNLPVEQVSWDDCKAFCKKSGLSLPTEAQWEYACRGGTTTAYSAGDSEEDLARVAWYVKGSWMLTHPVGEKSANDFGLFDMHGNVFEWCEDVWDEKFYKKFEASMKNPECLSGFDYRVFRGGDFGNTAVSCRSACRYGYDSSFRFDALGFRPSARPSP